MHVELFLLSNNVFNGNKKGLRALLWNIFSEALFHQKEKHTDQIVFRGSRNDQFKSSQAQQAYSLHNSNTLWPQEERKRGGDSSKQQA